MKGLRQRELARLISEARAHAQAERRSFSFTAQLIVMNVAFAFAPAVPGAQAIFGALPLRLALALVALSMSSVLFNTLLYRFIDPERLLYRRSEAIEIALLYAVQVAFVFFGGLTWSPLWVLCLFGAVFFAVIHPFATRSYAALFACVHGLFGAAALASGRPAAAAVAVGMGGAAFCCYALLSRVTRAGVLAVADRNFVRGEAAAAQLDFEKRRIAAAVGEIVSETLSTLIVTLGAIDSPDLEPVVAQARTAQREIANIAAQARPVLPGSLSTLATTLERRLAPLCVAARCEVERSGDVDARLDAAVALALLRISQELVRNAITHGGARAVVIALRGDGTEASLMVRDDGAGLHADHFERSTGGLSNVRRWAEEQGGTVHRIARNDGTELHVTLPARAPS